MNAQDDPLREPARDEGFVLAPSVIHARSEDLLSSEGMRGELLSGDTIRRERTVRFLPDALKEVAGVGMQRTGIGQSSPYLRGFTGFRSLMTLDGFRFNDSTWRDGPNQYLGTIDSEMVDELYLRFGHGNVRYGPDAIGGSLAIQTTPAGPLLAGREHTGRVSLRLSSADHGVVSHAEAGGVLSERFLYHVGGTLRNFEDLTGGRHVGLQEDTSYGENSADLKFTYLAAENGEVTVAHQREYQDDVPRTHRTIHGIDWRDLEVRTDELRRDLDQTREFTYLKLLSRDTEVFDELEAGLGFHVKGEDQSRIRSDLRSDHQGYDVRTLLGFLRMTSETSVGTLRYGADLAHDEVDSFRTDFNADGSIRDVHVQGPVADDAAYDLLGLYLEDETEIANGLVLTLGGRFTLAQLDANRVEDPTTGDRLSLDDDWSTWSGEIRLLDHLTDDVDAFVTLGHTSRVPNLSDLTRLDTARSSEIETPSPGLDPEHFTTIEIGARRRGRVSAGFSTYYTWVDDLVDRFPTGDVIDGNAEIQKANVGNGYVFGAEALLEVRFHPRWLAGVNATYMAGRGDTREGPGLETVSPLDKMPPLHATGRLRHEPAEHVWLEALVLTAAKQDRLSPDDRRDTTRIPPGGTPEYTVFGLRGGFEPVTNLQVTFAVENLTDRDYRYHGSGVNEPGTNAVLGLRYTF